MKAQKRLSRLQRADQQGWFQRLERDLAASQVARRVLRPNGPITIETIQNWCKEHKIGLVAEPTSQGTALLLAVDHGLAS